MKAEWIQAAKEADPMQEIIRARFGNDPVLRFHAAIFLANLILQPEKTPKAKRKSVSPYSELIEKATRG